MRILCLVQLFANFKIICFQVNIAQFHPVPGNGIVYGTKRGKVKVFYRNNYEVNECSASNNANMNLNTDK